MLQPHIKSANRDPIFTINQHYKHLISFRNGKVDGAETDNFH